ncbi:PDZ domain-containing protein [Psychrosphaera aquimarina]|uniref:PDZ domain-containing protein n=1 Tax=Psychrosphaera aquimarina TaxID=2044854 RepID=A0ABU3QXE3_9GAMM|nr:trypsin-like peptidase domain-containing protein [Psychrosphaera aquimarina]MDU0111944.1 PDZ domain-containing protein [Psychrosphaera aquimarina]
MLLNKTNMAQSLVLCFSLIFLTNCAPTTIKENWNNTVELVSSGVVSIQTDVPVSFDGKWNSSGYGTGFIVDSKRGIILTNRHIVTPGPVTAKAILINNEEIDLTPLYIDPVHDFGFYRYDPSQIKYLQPHQFKLSKKKPSVGQEIRIIGNDAGQKISILDGTIARLDREAPAYGRGRYNDFNISYIQAATASSGGSSGSPVINIQGEVVALNAGGQSKSANAFYLPLEKINIALKKLQTNEQIYRGTIQTTFIVKPYAELQRLGLNNTLEVKYREQFPDVLGLLVVNSIIPESSASKSLEVGDILLDLNGQSIAEFSTLETNINNNVGQSIKLAVLRRGELLSLQVDVDDLDTITPSSYLKFDGGIFHNLSYQQARHYNKPIKGVYVANSAGSFKHAGLPHNSVITEFNGVHVDTVEEFNNQLKLIKNGTKVHLRYFNLNNPNTSNYALVEVNSTWFEFSFCKKDAALGHWPCSQSMQLSEPDLVVTDTTNKPAMKISDHIEDALVEVSFSSPYSIQGRSGSSIKTGTGVIVNIEKGLVVVARNVVLSSLGDVDLTFNNRLEVKGKVEYIHPLHNLALVSFKPESVAKIALAQVSLSKTSIKKGDRILQMGLNYDGVVEYRETNVDTIDELWLKQFEAPQFIERNIEVVNLINPNLSADGILLNEANEMTAFWTIFNERNGDGVNTLMAGITVDYIAELIEFYESKNPIYSIDLNLTTIAPVNALKMGLPEEWLVKSTEQNSSTGKLLIVYNVAKSSKSAEIFKRGDILLSINDTPVSSFRQVELLSQSPELKVTYFSEGKVYSDTLTTARLTGNDIEQVFYWSGLYLHTPHRAAQQQGNVGEDGVYVASYRYGSPATRYGLYAMQRIVEIDGQAIKNTDDFVKAVKGKKHQESVLIKTLDFRNTSGVITLRVDNNYWPFYEIKYKNGHWQKINHLSVTE